MTEVAGYPVHPAAELFPLMTGDAFEELVADIDANGQAEPIVLDAEGNLIDGRNRARACERLALAPSRRVYPGDDVLQYVVSCNLHRRHLTDSQRAMIAAKLARRPEGRFPGEQLGDITELPPSIPQAAEMFGVGATSVGKAKLVIREGVDRLRELVEDGTIPVATGARVATELPPEEQNDYVEKVKGGADPVQAAPPPRESPRPPRPPRPAVYGPRRKHLEMLEALTIGLSGYAQGLHEITELDASVTAEEAARIRGDLSKSIRELNRINLLVKERSAA